MSYRRMSRRRFLGSSLVLIGCTRLPAIAEHPDEPELPPAPWPEDDMPQPEASDLTQPLVLWGSVIAQPNVDSAVPNEQLANPFGLPMELLAVRFMLTPIIETLVGAEADAQPNARMTGGGVKVKFDLGPATVASDIPLSMFGDMRDTYENGLSTRDTPVSSGEPVAEATVYPNVYDWRLKYPLYIPAGKVMTAVFTPVGINPLNVKVDVIYICRTWDQNRPEPKTTKVPWATSFESKTFKYATDTDADQAVSSNLDVLNPFGTPLELSRISGRCTTLQLTGGPAEENYITEDYGLFRQLISTMRMRSSRGFDLIRTPVMFDGVFPVNWRSWEILDGWQMAPQEYYRVQIDTEALPDPITAASVETVQFSVGIVGYRDVAVAALKGES